MTTEEFNLIKEKVKTISEQPNSSLIEIMDKTSIEFEIIKSNIISLTYYLDDVENIYNITLKEYQNRNNG